MRGSLAAFALAAAALAASLQAAASPPQSHDQTSRVGVHRKTMGFGPEHPHAIFVTNIPTKLQVSHEPSSRPAPPFEIAKLFAARLITSETSAEGRAEGTTSFYVRPDSYYDKLSGIVHVYLRQIVHGIEVADGDVNVNVDPMTGQIISYGSSIHTDVTNVTGKLIDGQQPANVHRSHCRVLDQIFWKQYEEWSTRVEADYPSFAFPTTHEGQTVMGDSKRHLVEQVEAAFQESMGKIPVLLDWNCRRFKLGTYLEGTITSAPSYTPEDPFAALLEFMVHAMPSEELAYSIATSPEDYLHNMSIADSHLTIDGPFASRTFEIDGVPDTVDKVRARLAWMQVPKEGSQREIDLELVWKYEVPMANNWYEAAVTHRAPHSIVSVVDWAADGFSDEPVHTNEASTHLFPHQHPTVEKLSSRPNTCEMKVKGTTLAPVPEPRFPHAHSPALYNVFAWGVNDPSEANRTFEFENFDSLASPAGWHVVELSNDPARLVKGKTSYRNSSTTWGNNVFAHEDWEGANSWVTNYRPEGVLNATADRLEFDFPYDPQETNRSDAMAEAKKYINITVTQLFYTSNLVHDLFYRYGFDEVSGNFQQHNFGRGGKEGDAVIANAQDGSGFNNANFMTPPDGQNGRCRMYLWNTANPYRDGDLEAGIVIHELAHGLSTRLTGGPSNSGCLGWGESGGMGEGWGDFLATTIRSVKDRVEDAKRAEDGLGEPRDYPMGAWAANKPGGIRNYLYSLDMVTNPSTYETLDKPGYWGVHAIGEVWAEMLWVVEQHLIRKHGFSDTLFPPKPLANGTIPLGDFYRDTSLTNGLFVPKHGNTLAVQLVISGMKLQPCRPSFFDARDAIIAADKHLTGGENFCTLWRGFAERGLGPDAMVEGQTPWGGGVRTNDFKVPKECLEDEPSPAPKQTPGYSDEDEDEK